MARFEVRIWRNSHLHVHEELNLRETIFIGDHPQSCYLLPSTRLVLHRIGNQVFVNGHGFLIGESLQFHDSGHDVLLQRLPPSKGPRRFFDRTLFIFSLLLFIVGNWIFAVEMAVEESPSFHHLSGVFDSWEDDRLQSLKSSKSDIFSFQSDSFLGPKHIPDDQLTNVGYFKWYVNNKLPNDRSLEAWNRLGKDEKDPVAHWIIGQLAYNIDNYYEAKHHLQIAIRDLELSSIWYELGRSYLRLGLHEAEIKAYLKALSIQSDHDFSRGFLAVAYARTSQFNKANEQLSMLTEQSTEPFISWIEAKIDLLNYEPETAADKLIFSLENIDGLPQELQSELLRDISLDPIFSELRNDTFFWQRIVDIMGENSPQFLP